LEVVDGRVRPAGDRLGGLRALSRVGNTGVVDGRDHRLRRLDRLLEPVTDEGGAALRRLGLRLLDPQRAARVGVAEPVDDRLDLPAPDGDGTADRGGPLARWHVLTLAVVAADQRDHSGDRDDPGDDDDDPEPRSAHHASFPGFESSSTNPTSRRQNRSTVGIETLSSGECGASICGPNEIMSSPGTLSPITAVWSPACTAVTIGSSPNSRTYDACSAASARESRSG